MFDSHISSDLCLKVGWKKSGRGNNNWPNLNAKKGINCIFLEQH